MHFRSTETPLGNLTNLNIFPAVERTDADVGMSAIWPNAVMYSKPVNDPLFSAHNTTFRDFAHQGENYTLYTSDRYGGIVGCTEQVCRLALTPNENHATDHRCQYQFCIARSGQDDLCTPLSSLPAKLSTAELPGADDLQLAILKLLLTVSTLNDITNAPNAQSLQVSAMIVSGLVPELPDDQWKKEVMGWEAWALAGIQILFADFAIGPKVRDPAASYTMAPTTAGEKQLCGAMKMRKSGGFA